MPWRLGGAAVRETSDDAGKRLSDLATLEADLRVRESQSRQAGSRVDLIPPSVPRLLASSSVVPQPVGLDYQAHSEAQELLP
jgi:hypothetical protein